MERMRNRILHKHPQGHSGHHNRGPRAEVPHPTESCWYDTVGGGGAPVQIWLVCRVGSAALEHGPSRVLGFEARK